MLSEVGGALAGDTGRTLGNVAGKLLEVFGLGSYKVRKNSFLQQGGLERIGNDQVPRISNRSGTKAVKICREEYIGDLFTGSGSTPTPFTLDNFNINPANPALFPWLSTIANQFEEYCFNGLLVTLKTMASDVSTTLSLGTMFGATQYDINDPVFTDKQELLNYYYASSVKVSDSVILPVECDRKQNVLNHLYVASGNQIPTGADPKFYNLGNLSIGTFGCPAQNTPVCEVYVSYDIDLFKPKLATGGELALLTYSGCWRSGSVTGPAPLTGALPDPATFFPGEVLPNVIGFPPFMSQGVFLVYISWAGGSAAITHPSVSATGCTLLSWQSFAGPTASLAPQEGASVTKMTAAYFVNITETNANLTFGSNGVLPTTPEMDLVITQVNGGLTLP
jgi:hypothetical protein